MKYAATVLTGLLVWVGGGSLLLGQKELPPVSYVCPMPEHAQVLDDKPGKCPICTMVLVPVRIDQAYSCPTHAAVIADKPGVCPLDKRDLLPVTVSLYWTCPDKPDEHLTEPGRCANGAPRKAMREQRAHGDHNPRHGGQFFMASDKWHHIEAAYPRAGVLRVFVYDNFTKPAKVSEYTGRAVTRETFDSQTRTTRELEAVPLKPVRSGQMFEARIKAAALPARVTVKMKFDPRLPEERFDFTFDAYSKEPEAPPVLSRAPAPVPGRPEGRPLQPSGAAAPSVGADLQVGPTPPPQGTVPAAVMTGGTTSSFEAARAAQVLPGASAELIALLKTRGQEVQSLLDSGQFGAIYVPALLSKDVALALENHVHELADRQRMLASRAIKRIVVSAFQLDAFGDLGNRDQLTHAYRGYAAAIDDLVGAYAAR